MTSFSDVFRISKQSFFIQKNSYNFVKTKIGFFWKILEEASNLIRDFNLLS